MAEYSITLTDEELEEVMCGLGLIIDRCCDYEEEKPIIDLIEKINKQTRPTADVAEVKQIKSIRDDLKWWLETNTEKGVVHIPEFSVKKMIAKMDGGNAE